MEKNQHMTAEIRSFDEAHMVCDEQPHCPTDEGLLADKKAMEAELNELRYRLEQNIEQRTGQLMRRMTLLESCNATLCDKLASAQRKLGVLTQSSDWTKNLIDTSAQDDWIELVITA